MSILTLYKEITRVKVAVPRGALSGMITVNALTIPLKEDDNIWIRTPYAESIKFKLTADAPIGATAIRVNVSLTPPGVPSTMMGIPVDSAVMLPDNEEALLARTSYQYMNCTGKINAGTSQNWSFGHLYGVQYYNWNQDGGTNGTTVDTSTITISRQYQHLGFRVPFDCELVGFTGSGKNSNGNRDYAGGLFVGTPDYGTANDINPVLRAYSSGYNEGCSFTSRAAAFEDLTRSHSISAGEVIFPAIKGLTATNDTLILNFTIVLKLIKA